MTRVLVFDLGMTLGWGALGGGKAVASGSVSLRGSPRNLGVSGRHCDEVVRQLILRERPGVVGFAIPFVGQRFDKKSRRFIPIQPDAIRPLMSFMTIVEMVCDELKIRCVEVSEQEARRAFLVHVPTGSKPQKIAVQRGCRERLWPFGNEHAADALCVAARVLELIEPNAAHEATPLFSQPAPRRVRKSKPKTGA